MIKVEVTDDKKIKIYNNGVLIIEEKNYNNVGIINNPPYPHTWEYGG